jgi:Pyruvate/2-oxoacid:ferredoxin oxidoreductase delta subunit
LGIYFKKKYRGVDKIKQKIDDSVRYRVINNEKHKICRICELYFPMSNVYFYTNKTSRDSFDSYCKPCASKKSRQWEIDNPEKYKALNQTKLPSKNPIRLERLRTFRKTEESKEYMVEWRNNNKDKTKVYTTRAKKHDITKEEWNFCKDYFNNCCAYCDLHIDNHFRIYAKKLQKIDFHKEHVDHNGSDKIDNCIPSCLTCNTSKHDKELSNWYNESNKNYKVGRLQKIHKWLTEDWKNIR